MKSDPYFTSLDYHYFLNMIGTFFEPHQNCFYIAQDFLSKVRFLFINPRNSYLIALVYSFHLREYQLRLSKKALITWLL